MSKRAVESLQNYIYNHTKGAPRRSGNYDKVINKLYIGNMKAAADPVFFRERNIKAVLNCTKDVDNTFANGSIEYMRIPVNDNITEVDFKKMFAYANSAVEFIHKHVDLDKHATLVNCHAGRQRSAAGVAMYLMKYHKMSVRKACEYLLTRRPEVFHYGESLNFAKTLIMYEEMLKKCT